MMRNFELSKEQFGSAARFASDLSPTEVKSLLGKLDRQRAKHKDAARAAGDVESKYQPMRAMGNFDLYQRLAGEAEARAVQKRMGMNALERRQTFPLDSYDVPINELIVR